MNRSLCLIPAALAALLLATPPARADGCGVVRRAVVVKEKVVVAEVVATPVLVAQFVPFAAYGAGFNPGYVPQPYAPPPPVQAQAAPGGGSDAAAILAELRKMNARMDAIERRQAAPPPEPPPGAAQPRPERQSAAPAAPAANAQALAVLQAKCAQCHARGSEKDGGGFILMDGGSLAALSDRQAVKTLSKVRRNEMPPEKDKAGQKLAPLTDEEFALVADLIESRK